MAAVPRTTPDVETPFADALRTLERSEFQTDIWGVMYIASRGEPRVKAHAFVRDFFRGKEINPETPPLERRAAVLCHAWLLDLYHLADHAMSTRNAVTRLFAWIRSWFGSNDVHGENEAFVERVRTMTPEVYKDLPTPREAGYEVERVDDNLKVGFDRLMEGEKNPIFRRWHGQDGWSEVPLDR